MLLPLLFALLAPAHADDGKKDKDQDARPAVEMSGKLFAHYKYDLSEGADGYNEFGLDRAYLRADGTITDRLSTRVTLDANRLSDPAVDTRYRVFVKHAYLEWKTGMKGVKGQAGVIETPFGPMLDDFWGHRYIEDNFPAVAIKLATADAGIGATGKHMDGMVNWGAVLVNGEGYNKLEVDSGKQAQVKVTVDPMAGNKELSLPITGFVAYAFNPNDASQLIASGVIGFDQKFFTGSVQALFNQQYDVNGFGYSVVALPRVPKVATLVFRMDHYDPNTEADDDASTKLIVGASHNFHKKVAVAGTFQQTSYEATPDLPSQGVFLNMLAGF